MSSKNILHNPLPADLRDALGTQKPLHKFHFRRKSSKIKLRPRIAKNIALRQRRMASQGGNLFPGIGSGAVFVEEDDSDYIAARPIGTASSSASNSSLRTGTPPKRFVRSQSASQLGKLFAALASDKSAAARAPQTADQLEHRRHLGRDKAVAKLKTNRQHTNMLQELDRDSYVHNKQIESLEDHSARLTTALAQDIDNRHRKSRATNAKLARTNMHQWIRRRAAKNRNRKSHPAGRNTAATASVFSEQQTFSDQCTKLLFKVLRALGDRAGPEVIVLQDLKDTLTIMQTPPKLRAKVVRHIEKMLPSGGQATTVDFETLRRAFRLTNLLPKVCEYTNTPVPGEFGYVQEAVCDTAAMPSLIMCFLMASYHRVYSATSSGIFRHSQVFTRHGDQTQATSAHGRDIAARKFDECRTEPNFAEHLSEQGRVGRNGRHYT